MRHLLTFLALTPFLGSSAGAVAVDAQVRTQAGVEIREAATVSILADAPFRMLITSGGMTSYLYSPKARGPQMAFHTEQQGATLFILNDAQRTAGQTSNSELLSVSVEFVSTGDIASGANRGSGIPVVLAQFN